ncbi:hypothetical protein CQA15_29515, partial [Klebsiella pneumoniae]|uniref:flagellin n=1 Tax=Klebsiella pneumoniae TaxID=573 RepID=UPI000BD4D801
AAASAAIGSMDVSIRTVTNTRATFGAVQNRFEAVIANMQAFTENLSASRSCRICSDRLDGCLDPYGDQYPCYLRCGTEPF